MSGRDRGAVPMPTRRIAASIALAATIAAGLATRADVVPELLGDVAGDALYTVAVYAGTVLLLPRLRPAVVGLIAGGWSVAVELFQATGIPIALAEAFRPIALVLGTGFDPRDLVVYVATAVVASSIDVGAGAARRTRRGAAPLLPTPEPSRSVGEGESPA